jgi:hypothetical protein
MPGASAAPPEMSSALEWVIRDFSEKSLLRKLFRMSHGRPHALQQWHICGRRMQQMHGRGSERCAGSASPPLRPQLPADARVPGGGA